ncbi:MAG: hypothetical protein D6731_10020 [Planctomycetota bacterium]|nr:MAG: hypothetical protein D6731_10020 [Planctomycetota bacterium]
MALLAPVRADGLLLRLAPGVEPAALRSVLADLERANAAGLDACLKWGIASAVCRSRLATPAGEVEVAAKLFRYRGLRGALSDLLRGSKAARALRGYERVAAADLPTAEPLAIAERRRGGLVVESWLVTRFLPGARELPRVVEERREDRSGTLRLARAVGDLVGRLHAAGIDHPDLKHLNILVGAGEELFLLDLDALVPARPLTWRRRVRALGQLEAYAARDYPWAGPALRRAFLRAYLARNPALRPQRRALLEDARAWAEARLEHWRRKAARAARAQARFEAAQARREGARS